MSTAGVIGAGAMGLGIAQIAATSGWDVLLADVSADAAQRAYERLVGTYNRLAEKGKMSPADCNRAVSRVRPIATSDSMRDCEIVIEAVFEDFSVKRDVLASASASAGERVILATNTSSLSVTALGEAIGRPTQVVGMHFFNPVPLMPLVEIVAGGGSDPARVDRTEEIARAWGKTTVRAKDTPGFIVNRVARGFYLEPMRMLDEGIAGVDEIDGILKRLGGFRMGPFELMDLIGIDVNYSVSQSVWNQLGQPARLRPHAIQEQLVASGRLGRKSKRGFYSYQPEHPVPDVLVRRRSFELPDTVYKAVRLVCDAAETPPASSTEQYVFARTLAAIVNEAGLVLDAEVATEENVDTAMKLATNYPFGPVEWARRVGLRTCRLLLDSLNDAAGDGRFSPAAWLRL